jgi:hypothetical protein
MRRAVPLPCERTGRRCRPICPEGLAYNVAEYVTGPGEVKWGFRITTHTTKRFDCANRNDSFVLYIEYNVRVAFTSPPTWDSQGPWSVTAGTGAYERLIGKGRVESWPANEYLSLFHDVFTGAVYSD